MHPDARKCGVWKKELFLRRTASTVHHQQPLDLIKDSEKRVLCWRWFSSLDFPKLPIRGDVA